MNPQLRLLCRSGAEILARLVYPGDTFGPGGRRVNGAFATIVEFVRPGFGADHVLGDYAVDQLVAELRPGWSPGEHEGFALEPRTAERLRRWLASPHSIEDVVVVLVGDDEVLRKVGVALSPLGLEQRFLPNGAAALDSMRRLPPQLAVVGQEVIQVEPLTLVRQLRAAPETKDVPVVVVGGDAAEAKAAGAALHVTVPLETRPLLDGVAGLLELV